MRFLIVSSDDQLRSRLADDLRARSFDVDETAAPAAGELSVDRVVIDATRPNAPGHTTLDLVRDVVAAFPGVPVLMLAPFPSAALMRMALRIGAVHCVPRTESAAAIVAAFDEAERPVDLAPRPETAFASLDEARWQHIGRALETSRGNISGAARLLGIHRQSLQRILRSLKTQGASADGADDFDSQAAS